MAEFSSERFSFGDDHLTQRLTLTPSQVELSTAGMPNMAYDCIKMVWGTTINIQNTCEKFKEFVRGHPKYSEVLTNMNITRNFVLDVDCDELEESLRMELLSYPQEVIPLLESSLCEMYMESFIQQPHTMKIRPYNVKREITIRNVEPGDIDKVISLTGMVVRTSAVIPEIRRAVYRCVKCKRQTTVDSIKGIINEPSICECGGKHCFEIKHNEGEYTDKQIVKIQELPENTPDAATPSAITVVAKDDLVDSLVPGDRVTVCGILRAIPVKVSPNLKKLKNCFRVYIEMLSGKVLNKKKEETSSYLSEIDKLRRQKNIYDILTASIAPSIYGMDNVKKSLLLQLFGGVSKSLTTSRLRGDINILLVGDPGISKSQLLGFVHRVADRGMYTSGRGSSAVGLTASVSKDPDSGQYVLESGALVLSDQGICCIDEFDKMNEPTRSVLHEAMEQQTVSIAKAGIITTLNARCSVLASCNPIESKYNVKKSILENINLPPTLLSRFDIVAVLVDRPDDRQDRRVAEHILGMYLGESDEMKVVSADLLRAYVKEARKIEPVLTAQAIEVLVEAYVDLRQLDNGKTITATTRQLESLVRLSEAHARMRFSYTVDVVDVKEAIRLIMESLLLYAVDPRTGKIDIDMVITGKSASEGKQIDEARESIMKNLRKRTTYTELLGILGVNERILSEALKELDEEEVIVYDKITGDVEKILY